MEEYESDIKVISKKIRTQLFFQKLNKVVHPYKISTNIINGIRKHKQLVISRDYLIQRDDRRTIIKKSDNLVSFPSHLGKPKFHPNTQLIIKELAAKISLLKNLKEGVYYIRVIKTNNQKEFFLYSRDISNIDDFSISDDFFSLLNSFCDKYQDYCFPNLADDGTIDFDEEFYYGGSYIYFYIPGSNHQLLKGLETSYI